MAKLTRSLQKESQLRKISASAPAGIPLQTEPNKDPFKAETARAESQQHRQIPVKSARITNRQTKELKTPTRYTPLFSKLKKLKRFKSFLQKKLQKHTIIFNGTTPTDLLRFLQKKV